MGKSQILIENFATAAVENLQVGDVILDANLTPVEVVAVEKSFLGTKSLYQFGHTGPIFTSEHQFVAGKNQYKIGVMSKMDLLNEKPQLEERSKAIFQLDQIDELLQFSNGSVNLAPFELKKLDKNWDNLTLVYYILTSGDDGTYIVDNFVSVDELPDFDLWPMTYATIGQILVLPGLNLPDLKNIDDDNLVMALAKELTQDWKRIISSFDFENVFPVSKDIEIGKLWEDKAELMRLIASDGKMPFAMHLNSFGAKILHQTLDDEKIAISTRIALMQEIVMETMKKLKNLGMLQL